MHCVCTVEKAEEHFDLFGDSSSQLLSDVMTTEQHMLDSSQPLGCYQGPAVPMPSLKNNCVILPATPRSPEKPNFDLGFCFEDKDEQPTPPQSADFFKVP